MMTGLLSSLQFTSPWMLAGLATLPLIWWLLRLTPPRPETVAFPPATLLLGLRPRERTPIRSPWWLTLLRVLVAAAVIAALAGPVIKPHLRGPGALSRPLLAVVDNGWAAGSRWQARQSFAAELASRAEDAGQTLFLIPTAGAASPLRPLTPAEFRQRFALIAPQPFAGDRGATAAQIEKELAQEHGKLQVAWLADGNGDAGAEKLFKALIPLTTDGTIDVYTDAPGAGALAVTRVQAGASVLKARVSKSETGPRAGEVAGVTIRGEKLAAVPFGVARGEPSADVALDLPLELRNQVARLQITGEDSAGGVYLLDSRSQRRRVGLIGGEGTEEAQPLLSPDYYLERALKPFSEVTRERTANLDQATSDLIGRSPSIIILSDVGRLSGLPAKRLDAYVEKGGMLIRFAGPRLERGGDALLPAPLREGGRSLGGTMTWTSPQTPAPFERGSPFEGIEVPKDVRISRQVLMDPATMPREAEVWARLADGTPLVTAAKRGSGLLVFFHITANPDWSNLPMSGLFVEMMRKVLDLSSAQVAQANSGPSAGGGTAQAPGEDAFLKPWRVLDGFGKLSEPGERAEAITASKVEAAHAAAINPAGLYGPETALRAINIMTDKDKLVPLALPDKAHVNVLAEAGTIALTPWLFLAALSLFLIDGAVCALIFGRGAIPWRQAAASVFAFGLFAALPLSNAKAEAALDDKAGSAEAFALQASLDTRLAYVLTGDEEADRVSKAGLNGLSKVLAARTAVEPGEPIGVDPARDELVFFPLLYWPVLSNVQPLPDKVLAKIDAYMKQGGLIIFDTKNGDGFTGTFGAGGSTPLGQLLGKLDLPPLQRVPEDHVLTKAFYLLQTFPGRWDNGDPWVEASSSAEDSGRRGVKSDGVSSIIVTSNDFAAAWALDEGDRPMFAAVPGGEEQREMSYRAGVNIVMYALTGNYKGDQVHVPDILQRLGH